MEPTVIPIDLSLGMTEVRHPLLEVGEVAGFIFLDLFTGPERQSRLHPKGMDTALTPLKDAHACPFLLGGRLSAALLVGISSAARPTPPRPSWVRASSRSSPGG